MNLKIEANRLARQVLHYADRKGYGLGECGYYFQRWAWDTICIEHEATDRYEMYKDDNQVWSERKRLQDEQPEIYHQWQELATMAHERAETIAD